MNSCLSKCSTPRGYHKPKHPRSHFHPFLSYSKELLYIFLFSLYYTLLWFSISFTQLYQLILPSLTPKEGSEWCLGHVTINQSKGWKKTMYDLLCLVPRKLKKKKKKACWELPKAGLWLFPEALNLLPAGSHWLLSLKKEFVSTSSQPWKPVFTVSCFFARSAWIMQQTMAFWFLFSKYWSLLWIFRSSFVLPWFICKTGGRSFLLKLPFLSFVVFHFYLPTKKRKIVIES